MFNLGFVLVFTLLGTWMMLHHMPKDKEFKSYRVARYTLGIGFAIMALYCLVRFLPPPFNCGDYGDFWLNITVSLTFSWLNYATFLFLLDTPRYKLRSFFVDGIVPIGSMIVLGLIGLFVRSMQPVMHHLFCAVFAIKCAYMFRSCEREWRLCEKELENFYGTVPDIRWIRFLIWITLSLSVCTVMSYYFPAIHLVFDIVAPAIYVYMTLKIVNFAPRKIDSMRGGNLTMVKKPKEKKVKADIAEKIGPKVDEWVRDKKFCRPDLTIKDVAMDIGTNHYYLSQYLNNVLGVTFQMWLNTLRIEESKVILRSGEKILIEEVGARVGIPQNYNFSRWFKIVTDMTPYQYKKQ